MVVGAALMLVACSSGTDYPQIFSEPAARVDTPLSPDQVKNVTGTLVDERSQLGTDAQIATQPDPGPGAPATTPAGKTAAAKKAAKGSKTAKATTPAKPAPTAQTTTATETAGADPKP